MNRPFQLAALGRGGILWLNACALAALLGTSCMLLPSAEEGGTTSSGEPAAAQAAPPNGETTPPAAEPDQNPAAPVKNPWSGCVNCHDKPVEGLRAVTDSAHTRAHWRASTALTDEHCTVCHDSSQHDSGVVRLWANPGQPSDTLGYVGDPSQLVDFCTKCHSGANSPTVHTNGTAWTPVCTECHDVHNAANTNRSLVRTDVRQAALGKTLLVVFTARTGPGSFSDGSGAGTGVCQVCHTATRYHRGNSSGAAHRAGQNCTTCHPHATGFVPPGGTSCIGCHSTTQGQRPRIVNSDGSGGHHLAASKLTDADCATCHDLSQHTDGAVRLWADPGNHTAAFEVNGDPNQLVPFCATCHNSADHPTIHTTGAAWQPACTECHALHDPGNANLALVGGRIRNRTLGSDRPVVFTARSGAGSFGAGSGANDGVCQVCHTATIHYRYDGGGIPHNAGADCTTCHGHRNGFIPIGGTSCIGCHSAAQGPRRAMVGEFGLASHHVAGGTVTDADCRVCHDITQHQQGKVRLRNVDDPNNPAAVINVNGNPLTSPAAARTLQPFCLACHDANGAGGAAPFSDGRMPPRIDAASWAASSHSAGQTTCLGDGETFGCHSTGHGSVKNKLLAPWNGGQPGVPGDPLRQEEGMCYSCHRAGGTAHTDVQSQFALATHHKVSALEQTDGAKVECANCHDPHTARTGQMLINPATGAPWAGTGEGFCLTCHGGTPPPGVSFPPTSPGTGYDKSAFVGTTHSTAIPADACRHCHDPHGSANLALLHARYVVTDNNPYPPGGGDYAACWRCHSEDRVVRQVNAFSTNHEVHVDWNQAPCTICHDVHRGFDRSEPGLIDFDYPIRRGGYDIQFIDGKNGSTSFWVNQPQTRGYCYIQCHSMEHTPFSYARQKTVTTDCSACH